ncbi:hypothetical protein ACOSHH_001959 [Klebsiella aerogenes]
MNNEIELTAALLTIEKCRELTNCPAGVDLQDWVKQLAAERDAALNAERVWETAMMEVCGEDGPASVAAVINALAAENVAQKNRTQQLIDIINNADNAYCMCGDAMKNHTYGGCGHPTGMFDYHYGKWLEQGNETSATDRIVAEAEARGVEKFAKKLESRGRHQDYVEIANAFAKQLREGADK